MRYVFISLALTLIPTAVAVSVAVSAADATGTASATVVSPAHTGNLLEPVAISTGVTGDLIIKIPGLRQPVIPREHLNSVPFKLSKVLKSSCRNAGTLVGCLVSEADEGLLQGNPVHDILVKVVAHDNPEQGRIRLTLSYN